MSACPLLWIWEPQNSHWQFLCEGHRPASGRFFCACDNFNNRSMEVCVHQGFSNVSTTKRGAFSGGGFEEDWVPGTSQTEFHWTLSRDGNRMHWWKSALTTRNSGVCQICDLSVPTGEAHCSQSFRLWNFETACWGLQ